MKFKLELGEYGLYYILYKKKWWHSWRYVMKLDQNDLIRYWDTIVSAQAYIKDELEKLKTK
jgi:hypothetical protein